MSNFDFEDNIVSSTNGPPRAGVLLGQGGIDQAIINPWDLGNPHGSWDAFPFLNADPV